MADLKTHTVKIKHRGFTYKKVLPDPSNPDNTIIAAYWATRGQEIEVLQDDFDKGTEIGAFYTEADEEAEANRTAALANMSVSEMDEDATAEWLRTAKPNVSDTVDAAGGDPDVAQRILDAEYTVTNDDPRQGVVDGLEKIIAE